MHEFVECCELRVYFERMKELINNCWEGDYVSRIEWKKLWLFGVNERKNGCNINRLNYVLSHARYAVKLRRNIAHYEEKKCEVWNIFKNLTERDIKLTQSFIGEEEFRKGFLDGSTFIERMNGDENEVRMNFG